LFDARGQLKRLDRLPPRVVLDPVDVRIARTFRQDMDATRTPRTMAIAWAEEERKAIEKATIDAATQLALRVTAQPRSLHITLSSSPDPSSL
jgi:hypothetical protein